MGNKDDQQIPKGSHFVVNKMRHRHYQVCLSASLSARNLTCNSLDGFLCLKHKTGSMGRIRACGDVEWTAAFVNKKQQFLE